MPYPTEPSWGTGRFRGPTSDATASFPTNVYLNAEEWLQYQDEEQLKLNLEMEAEFDSFLKKGGWFQIPNPYTPYVQALQARLNLTPKIIGGESTGDNIPG